MLIPSPTWESLCMARAEGVRGSHLPAQYPQLVKKDMVKKATTAPQIKNSGLFSSWVEQNASDPETLSPGAETLPHPADRAWSWLQKQHSSSEQISTKPIPQHSCCSSLSPQPAHCAQRGQDLAAFFCSTRLFILLPKTQQPAPRWAGHLALQGWINNHNNIFVRLSEWAMYAQTPAPCIFHFKFQKYCSSVFHNIC